jgi:hypothetical protein
MQIIKKYKVVFGVTFMVAAFIVVMLLNNVSTEVTKADELALYVIYPQKPVNGQNLTFEDQISLIKEFKNSLHSNYPYGNPIDYYHEREPSDLVTQKSGFCYDFSRTIEKFLLLNNFEVRHVAIYEVDKNWGRFLSFFKPNNYSHSLLEVKTQKGWMIVDSLLQWVGLDHDNKPISFKQIRSFEKNGVAIVWQDSVDSTYANFYSPCAFYVYGLYSRHGCFYPPYNPIPDINLYDFVFHNFLSAS